MTYDVTFRPDDLARRRARDEVVRVIDVRTPAEFAHRHIPGSCNVPMPDLAERRGALAESDEAIVLVCESGRRAAMAERKLRDGGVERVHVLDGGVAAWVGAGLPVRRSDRPGTPWALERQVRLVAGGLVASSIAASVVWPAARYAAGAIGAGLVVAALTDTCAMGNLLTRLPHNRAQRCDLPTVAAAPAGPTEARS